MKQIIDSMNEFSWLTIFMQLKTMTPSGQVEIL